jgi:hypothetical protein
MIIQQERTYKKQIVMEIASNSYTNTTACGAEWTGFVLMESAVYCSVLFKVYLGII